MQLTSISADSATRLFSVSLDADSFSLTGVRLTVIFTVFSTVLPSDNASCILPKAAAAPEPTIAAAPVEKLPADALTREEAEKIALDYLGFTAEQVTRLRTEYEIDDGLPQFDIEFIQGDWEYEFEIHAENGQILSYDKDHKYD